MDSMTVAGGCSAGTRPHVVLTAFPFGTHAAPLLSLAQSLASSAPSAFFSFLSTLQSLSSLRRSSAAAHLPSNLFLIPISDGISGDGPPSDVEAQIGIFLAAFLASLKDGLEMAEEAAEGAAVSCIVSDAFLWMAADVANGMGATWVAVWTGGPQGLSAHLHSDLIRNTVGVGDQVIHSYGDKTLDFVPGLSKHRVSDLQEGIITGNLNSSFSIMLHHMVQNLPRAAALVLNTFEGLDPAIETAFSKIFTAYFLVGPFHLLSPSRAASKTVVDPHSCLSWLDCHRQATVAYISFGTVVTPPASELVELTKGLENSGVPFLWSLNDRGQVSLPPGFLDQVKETGQGKIVTWAPQTDILGHPAVSAFVSHCGWNSILESVACGVPMICRAIFAEQLVNARAVSDVWEFGTRLEGGVFTEEGTVKAFNLVLKGEEGKRMREKAKGLKEKAVAAVGPGGCSTKNLKELLKVVCGC